MESIRARVNESTRQERLMSDSQAWNHLCAAMDAVEDCQLAIDAYGTPREDLSEGDVYLRLYGLLQAMFVQQDAALQLGELLSGDRDLLRKFKEDRKDIRSLRNSAVGHPSKVGFKAPFQHYGISRATLSTSHFELYSFADREDASDETIDTGDVIHRQAAIVAGMLSVLVATLDGDSAVP